MLQNRYEFTMLIEVVNGNPNGDPDAGNSPRIDAETGHGIITDVCLKRKIRNYVEITKNGEDGFAILIKNDKSLNEKLKEAYEKCNLDASDADKKDKNQRKVKKDDVMMARDFMCKSYYDVRTFGAVMSTGNNPCGIVRGPVQITFAESISPINPQEYTITRQAKTTEDRQKASDTEMGTKHIVPYGLYKAEGFISAALANDVTDMTEEDLELLWEAIINMFEHDRSAARGKMCVRKLFVFKHETVKGNAPAHTLLEKIEVREKENITVPRSFNDYEILVDRNVPNGVELLEIL